MPLDGLDRPQSVAEPRQVLHDLTKDKRPESAAVFRMDAAADEEIEIAFVTVVLCSVQQFRSAVQVETELEAAFHRMYMDSMDLWELDLQTRLESCFSLSHHEMEMVEGRMGRDRDGALRSARNILLALPKTILVELMTRLLAASLSEQNGYDARTRSLLHQISRRLQIAKGQVERIEDDVMAALLRSASLQKEQELSAQQSKERTAKKWILTGIGAVAGGVMVGLTAGLAAPFVFPALATAAGLGSVAAFMASAGGIAMVSVIFGAAGAGLTGYRVTRRFGSVKEFSFLRLHRHGHSSVGGEGEKMFHVIIGVSGWLEGEEDVWQPWASCAARQKSEVYALRFEPSALLTLGRALATFITGTAASLAATELIKMTAISAALSALMFPVALLQSADLIDNPWSVGMDRARLAGQILADVLRRRVHGHRPVDLYGYSLGALVILSCLEELSKDPEGSFGIIENVVLFGLPASVLPSTKWHRYRCLVAGRFIHVFSRSDWVLTFLYRGASLQFDEIAGLAPLRAIHSIESVDFSAAVKGHLEYRQQVPELLSLLGL